MSEKTKWLVVTAGLGSTDFELAARRIRNAFHQNHFVDCVEMVTLENLEQVCPITSHLYAQYMNAQTKGFGFMSWKPEIVLAGLSGYWGEFQGVVWIDSGCEIMSTKITRIRFKLHQRFAIRNGVASFTLNTKEIQYTKRDLFDHFSNIDPSTAGNQIQTTWIFFHGPKGIQIAREWLEIVTENKKFIDLEESERGEYPQFIENRNDQSVFSLICKRNNVKPMKYSPTAGFGSIGAFFKGFIHPIWTTRNRTGVTVKSKYHIFVENYF
jgi:hypothetical protein